jgi:hypothetical protein
VSMPWDRFTPVEPQDRPTPAPLPPEPAPVPEQPPQRPPRPEDIIDWHEVLDQAWPAIREQAVGYARDTVGEIRKGHTVDVLNPTITATTEAGRELVVADAKSRSWRTLIQGLAFDVMAAIVAAVAVLSGADPFVKETWVAFGILLLKSVVSAVISYFMRLRITPTIRTPGEKMAVMPIPRPMIDENKLP